MEVRFKGKGQDASLTSPRGEQSLNDAGLPPLLRATGISSLQPILPQ